MNSTTIVQLVFVVLLIGVGVGVLLLLNFLTRRQHKRKAAAIVSSPKLLARWQYAPDEWTAAVAEEFTWVKHADKPGQVFISPDAIYVATGREERVINLSGKGKFVTHASYRGVDVSPLKIRVRWKVMSQRNDDPKDYRTEDHRIPVPRGAKEDANRVVQFFVTQAEQNPHRVTAVTSPDAAMSIFGKDA